MKQESLAAMLGIPVLQGREDVKYCAFILSPQSRKDLLALFPPRYERIVCHHVTLQFGDITPASLKSLHSHYGVFAGNQVFDDVFEVRAHFDDRAGVECLAVRSKTFKGGVPRRAMTSARLKGGLLHITHSLNQNRAPVESNQVLQDARNLQREIKLSLSGVIEVLG